MSTSLIYRSTLLYEGVMRTLYGRHYSDRLSCVAARVPDGAEVLELCCGPGTLYRRHLRTRVGGYTGLDANQGFVDRLRAQGIDARVTDLTGPEPLPSSDVAIMQASLYHFLPDAAGIIDRMLTAARSRVIIAEPVRNLSSSQLPLVGRLGRQATDPGVGDHAHRFDAGSLAALMERYAGRIDESFAIPGGREAVYVLAAGD